MSQQFFEEFCTESNLAGLSVACLEHHIETFYLGKRGVIPPYSQQIVESDLLYDLASLTKVVGTSTRILQLIQEGKLCFETPVCEVLPYFSNLTMTISNLLLHQSGLPADFKQKQQIDEQRLVTFFKAFQSSKSSTMIYSDLGFILLGWIIEAVDGMSLENSFKTHIFLPFGMGQTGYNLNATLSQFIPTEITAERGVIVGNVHDSKAYKLNKPIGSAGLFSTLKDLIKFSMIYLNNQLPDGSSLFDDDLYDKLMNYRDKGRTYGWANEFKLGVIYHTGFTGTSIGLDLTDKRGLILLTNRIHPDRSNQVFLKNREALYRSFFN